MTAAHSPTIVYKKKAYFRLFNSIDLRPSSEMLIIKEFNLTTGNLKWREYLKKKHN